MNTPLRKVAVACFVLFGLLLLNANWVQVVKASDYKNDPRNTRVLLREYDRQRGAILVGTSIDRKAIAQSTATTDALKYLRTYPGGAQYAPVTGFDSLVYGSTGIERDQDSILSGDDDRLFVRRLSDYITGRRLSGGSVTLTLNEAAQSAAYQGLGSKRGAVVAIDPRSGAVLAEASTPSYDPTALSSHDPKKISATYRALMANGEDALLNRGVQQTYPPGSTFKVITTAAALATGKYTPDTVIPAPTVLKLPQTDVGLRNFGGESCGNGSTTTLLQALTISCNTAYADLGLTLGADAVRDQADAFGFGSTSLKLPQSVAESVYPGDPTPPQVAQSAIGQFDVRVTPLQMAMVAAGIANGGTVMAPYLVASVQSPDLTVLDQASPEVLSTATTPAVAGTLRDMMVNVVEHGTGTPAQISGIQVAGKTGTAQHGAGAAPHAWFIAFAPAQDPVVAVAVLVEDGGNAGSEATGGKVAAPIARDVIRAVLGR